MGTTHTGRTDNMPGTKAGALKARETMQQLYGADYYANIGRLGGAKTKEDGTIKGFALNPELARKAGAKGGRVSRKVKKVA
jgi:hypothetical protein